MKNYITPDIEITCILIEHGFSASYGDNGEAGPYFDIDDNGEF